MRIIDYYYYDKINKTVDQIIHDNFQSNLKRKITFKN
jgi:hypothetical protein